MADSDWPGQPAQLPRPVECCLSQISHSQFRNRSTDAGEKFAPVDRQALHCRLSPTKAVQGLGQDYEGRLWDVLWRVAFTFKLADRGTNTVNFTVALRDADAKSGQLQNTDLHLRVVCCPGDKGEPVKAPSMGVTIGFPEDF
jgi:hypothetical protein